MKKRDRESSIDRLLRHSARPRGAAPAAGCLDAGMLAAWADGALSSTERAAAEAHAADCARCQAMLSAMARLSPPDTEAPRWRAHLGWLVPLTVAAAALVVWAVVPLTPKSTSHPPTAIAASQKEAESPAVAEPPPAAPANAASSAAAATPPATRQRLAAKPRARRDTAEEARSEKNEATGARETVSVEAQSADALAKKVEPAAPVASPMPAPSQASGLAADRAGARLLAARPLTNAGLKVIATPNASSRWRIGRRGAVEYSADGGTTWQPQETGTVSPLTAGASPSASVCWLVGPQGTVLLSTDARTWRRIVFPESIDLVSVTAADETHAVVTAADGRTLATADGGATWTPR